jgi:hypothetical protein
MCPHYLARKNVGSRVIKIAPRFGKLTGPIGSDTATVVHSCFASRVMDTFFTAIFPEHTRHPSCLLACPGNNIESFLNQIDDDDIDRSVSFFIEFSIMAC